MPFIVALITHHIIKLLHTFYFLESNFNPHTSNTGNKLGHVQIYLVEIVEVEREIVASTDI